MERTTSETTVWGCRGQAACKWHCNALVVAIMTSPFKLTYCRHTQHGYRWKEGEEIVQYERHCSIFNASRDSMLLIYWMNLPSFSINWATQHCQRGCQTIFIILLVRSRMRCWPDQLHRTLIAIDTTRWIWMNHIGMMEDRKRRTYPRGASLFKTRVCVCTVVYRAKQSDTALAATGRLHTDNCLISSTLLFTSVVFIAYW